MRKIALERANNTCEWPDCYSKEWLELAHIKAIGMGGSPKRKYDIDNVCILCKHHHDVYDGRQRVGTSVAYRDLLKGYLSYKYQEISF